MTDPSHPDQATLHGFLLGQLAIGEMELVEQHLCGCGVCAGVAETLPGDRLLDLLRRESSVAIDQETVATPVEVRSDDDQDHPSPHHLDPAGCEMERRKERAKGVWRFLGLGLLVGVLALSSYGCSPEGTVHLNPDPDGRAISAPPKPKPDATRPPPRQGKKDYAPG